MCNSKTKTDFYFLSLEIYTQLFVTACVGIHYFLLTGDRKIYSTLLYLVNVCNRGRINREYMVGAEMEKVYPVRLRKRK